MDKDRKLTNEPGALCLISCGRSLAKLPLQQAVAACRSMCLGLGLSAPHQAACERLIALSKSEQQAVLHTMRGMVRVSEGVERRKLLAERAVAQSYEAVGDSADEDSSDDEESSEDDYWDDAAVESGGKPVKRQLTEEERLVRMQRAPTWNSEWQREEKTKFGPTVGGIIITDARKAELKHQARRLAEKQMILKQKADGDDAEREDRQHRKRLARRVRARVQLRLFAELERLACSHFAKGAHHGGDHSKNKAAWTRSGLLAEMKEIYYTKGVTPWQLDSSLMVYYKFGASGPERLAAWVVACRLGKKNYTDFRKYFDREEREEEFNELEADFGPQLTGLETAFDDPRALIALEFPAAAVTAGVPSQVVVLLHIERGPFTFVAAPARFDASDESGRTLIVDDTILHAEPLLSRRYREELMKCNGKQGRLLAVTFDALRDETSLKATVTWEQAIAYPRKANNVQKTVQQKKDPNAAEPESPAAATKARRNVIAEFQADEKAREEARKEQKYGPRIVRQGFVSGKEDPDENAAKKKAARGGGKVAASKRAAAETSGGKPTARNEKENQDNAFGSSDSAESSEDDGIAGHDLLQKYNMTSEKERKDYIRNAKVSLELGGGCSVENFEIDIVKVHQVKVFAVSDDLAFTIQQLAKETRTPFRKHLVLQGGSGARYFEFHPRKDGWRFGKRMAELWAKRASLLTDFLHEFHEFPMNKRNPSLEEVAKWMAEEIKPFADQVARYDMRKSYKRSVERMTTFAEGMLKEFVEYRPTAEKWTYPTTKSKAGGADTWWI